MFTMHVYACVVMIRYIEEIINISLSSLSLSLPPSPLFFHNPYTYTPPNTIVNNFPLYGHGQTKKITRHIHMPLSHSYSQDHLLLL